MSEFTYATLGGDTVRVYRHSITKSMASIRDKHGAVRAVARAALSGIHDAARKLAFMTPEEKRSALTAAALASEVGPNRDDSTDPLRALIPDYDTALIARATVEQIVGRALEPADRIGDMAAYLRATLRRWAIKHP